MGHALRFSELLAACGQEKASDDTEIAINADGKDSKVRVTSGKATVRIGFTAPATPARATDWMAMISPSASTPTAQMRRAHADHFEIGLTGPNGRNPVIARSVATKQSPAISLAQGQ